MRRMYDLTLPLSADLPIWPGDPLFSLDVASDTVKGDDYRVSVIHTGVHTGTHVDAPRHVDSTGIGVDAVPLETMVGKAWVARFPPEVQALTGDLLEASGIPATASRLLLATANSRLWDAPAAGFAHDYVYVTVDGAEWMASRRILLVGIDYLSIGAPGPEGLAAHRTLLSAGAVIVEGLDLRLLPPGECDLVCLPLRLVGAEGAPARVVAFRQDGA